MMGATAKGACPRLTAPMETGDGLLARIVPTEPVPIDAFAALCAAARTHGNGLMEISARGSLQVRGLSAASAPQFASAVEALGIDPGDGVPVLANPLPHDPNAVCGCGELAAKIRVLVRAKGFALAPKVSVVIDDGGQISLDPIPADIRVRAVEAKRTAQFVVSIGGDSTSATPLGVVAMKDVPSLVVDLLEVIAAHGPRARAREIVTLEGIAPFAAVGRTPIADRQDRPRHRPAETIGLHKLHGEDCALGVALPFGQSHTLDLIALLRIARANGAVWAATAPQRTLLLGPIGELTAFALGTAADTLGFIVDARDTRRRVVACAGSPACASGALPARAIAARIAVRLGQGAFAVHVSGCAKGCAHPSPAPLTIVGSSRGGGFVTNGTARSEPSTYKSADDIVNAAVQLAAKGTADA